MAEITASMVKELRERTGAGMMECKKALTESNGDIDAAAEALRKSGLAKADKKADRVAAEGRVAFAQDGNRAAAVAREREGIIDADELLARYRTTYAKYVTLFSAAGGADDADVDTARAAPGPR